MKMDFCMERVSFLTTIACNLNCKLCAASSPYRAGEAGFSLEENKNVLDKFFQTVDYVKKFSIGGGEPLLWTSFPDFLKYLHKYSAQFGKLEIITNGTLVPKVELLEAAKLFGDQVFFLIDHYGNDISVNVSAMESLFTAHGIPYKTRGNMAGNSHCNGWVDFSDGSALLHNTQKEVEKVFSKCAQAQKMNFCFIIWRGIMYPCDQVRKCIDRGTTPANPNEYIALLAPNLSVKDLQDKIENLYHVKSLAACAYCNGMCEDSERFVPAEQLTKEEIECVKRGARSYREVCIMMNSDKEHPTPPRHRSCDRF